MKDLRASLGAEGYPVIRAVARRGYLLVLHADGAIDIAATACTPLPLPQYRSEMFGRDAELCELRHVLAVHRLVTVLGAGGIGKTVFALAAATRHAEEGPGQAAWVDLARLAEPGLLPTTIARALGLPVSPGDEPLRGLLSAARSSVAWLVLDNAEHLIEAVCHIAQNLLEAAPGLQLLVTSQAPLHHTRERLFRLSALHVPASNEAFSTAVQAPAVVMFQEPAQANDRRFVVSPDNLASVIRLCRRLDGLPLAIRLAAARVHLPGLSGLENHLNDHLLWLASPTRDAPTRQQTLAAALAWSYGLLAASEQCFWRRLGVATLTGVATPVLSAFSGVPPGVLSMTTGTSKYRTWPFTPHSFSTRSNQTGEKKLRALPSPSTGRCHRNGCRSAPA